jgi:hypothetical protein
MGRLHGSCQPALRGGASIALSRPLSQSPPNGEFPHDGSAFQAPLPPLPFPSPAMPFKGAAYALGVVVMRM